MVLKYFSGSVSRAKCHPQRAGGMKKINDGVRKPPEKSFVVRKYEKAQNKFSVNAVYIYLHQLRAPSPVPLAHGAVLPNDGSWRSIS